MFVIFLSCHLYLVIRLFFWNRLEMMITGIAVLNTVIFAIFSVCRDIFAAASLTLGWQFFLKRVALIAFSIWRITFHNRSISISLLSVTFITGLIFLLFFSFGVSIFSWLLRRVIHLFLNRLLINGNWFYVVKNSFHGTGWTEFKAVLSIYMIVLSSFFVLVLTTGCVFFC